MPIEEHFPNLATCEYRQTSEQTGAYNCVAWALGDSERWWEPIGRGYHWPVGLPFTQTVKGLIGMLNHEGFKVCPDDSLEADFEKVAIYANGPNYEHIARQLEDGKWTSKLGKGEDIEHTLEGLDGDLYGSVVSILRRRKR
jgi:hypothetical protein